jgi:hypothetical protein
VSESARGASGGSARLTALSDPTITRVVHGCSHEHVIGSNLAQDCGYFYILLNLPLFKYLSRSRLR